MNIFNYFKQIKILITTDHGVIVDGQFYAEDSEDYQAALTVLAARNIRLPVKHKVCDLPQMLQEQAQ